MTTVVTYSAATIDFSFGPARVLNGEAAIEWWGGTHTYTATCTIPRRTWRRVDRAIRRCFLGDRTPLRLGPWWVRRVA